MISTGYEGGEEERAPVQNWTLRKSDNPLFKMIVCYLEIREGGRVKVVGHINLKDEDEFNWLKRRIDGDRDIRHLIHPPRKD